MQQYHNSFPQGTYHKCMQLAGNSNDLKTKPQVHTQADLQSYLLKCAMALCHAAVAVQVSWSDL